VAKRTRHIALLRGINLGARNRVSMPALRELAAGLGYEDPRTLVQSGNLVLTSAERPDAVARRLEEAIAGDLGVKTRVVVRTRDELADVVARDPFGDLADEPKRYQVTFLEAEPDPAVVERLSAVDVAPERVVFSGREVYAWHPDGIQRSRAAKVAGDRALGDAATARNWNTVTKLLELADSATPTRTASARGRTTR
jgi:uncharacterized protein (DUF1697 family)